MSNGTPQPMPAPQPQSPPQKSGGMGCFLKGCLVLFVLFLIGLGLVGWGAYTFYKNVYALTSDAPVSVPVYQSTPEQYAEVKGRIDQFQKDVDAHKPATIRLTDADLNTMVARDPNYDAAKGHVYFTIKDSFLHVLGSFPLDNVPTMKGRYLNATITLAVSIEDGILTLQPTEVKAGDHALPPDALKALQSMHWGDQANTNPDFKKLMDKVKSLRMEQDAIVLETK